MAHATYGLNAARVSCARVIINQVQRRGLSLRAAEIAITTAIVESGIRNIDNGDRDSLGLFQQRPSQGWGTPAQILDPPQATNAFLDAMVRVSNWGNRPIGDVCQAVQRSGLPYRYGEEAPDGIRIARALWDAGPSAVGVYRAGDLDWYRHGASTINDWGEASDQVITGDWNGDGVDKPAVYRASTGTWIFYRNVIPQIQHWGEPGDVPLAGDFDGDGDDEPAVYRPSTRSWIFYAGIRDTIQTWGEPGDIPMLGDWNGNDGIDLPAVFRPSAHTWIFYGNIAPQIANWGEPGDLPVSADWNGDGTDDVGIFRPSEQHWYFRGVADEISRYGQPGDRPIAGNWNP